MLTLCSFFQIMPPFFKIMLFEKMQISPKYIYIFQLEAVRLQERNATNPQLISNKHVVQVNMHTSTR